MYTNCTCCWSGNETTALIDVHVTGLEMRHTMYIDVPGPVMGLLHVTGLGNETSRVPFVGVQSHTATQLTLLHRHPPPPPLAQ